MIRRAAALSSIVGVALSAAALAPACGEQVFLGDNGDDACLEQPCGTPCGSSSCADPNAPDCVVTKGTCDGEGRCLGEEPPACPLPKDCFGLPCGAPCDPCPKGDPTCPPGKPEQEASCDGAGSCVIGQIVCPCAGPDCPPPPDPCSVMMLVCGTPCDPCMFAMGPCQPPMFPTACDMGSTCIDASMVLCKDPTTLCFNQPCGAPCQLCDPMNDPGCPMPMDGFCDSFGMCSSNPVMCP